MSCPGAAGRDGNVSPSEPDQRFPRSFRLTARRQFLEIYERGRRVGSDSFVLFGIPNTVGHCRLGITVSRKIGGAVLRNRVKRLVREAFRRNKAALSPALDLVLNARQAIVARSAAEIEREFLASFALLARRFR